jgi:hypothetical protein
MSEVSSRLRWKVLLAISSLALVAAATVLPITLANAAPQKIYDLTIAPTTLQAGTPGQTLTATFKNATPSGNSAINSLKLFAQAPAGFVITGATGVGNEVIQPGGQSVWVSSLPSVKPGKSYVLTLTVTTPAATDCAGADVTWTADVRAGNSFTGDTFALNDGVGTTTHIGVTCGLTFSQQPTDALKGAVITPAIQVTGSPASLFSGDSIDLAIADDSPTTATLGGDTSQNANASGVATFNDISLPTSGNYKLVATSGGATSDSSDTFMISDGVLGCGAFAQNPPDGVTLQRIGNADPGEPCVLIPYILTRDGNAVEFLKDLATQQSAQFIVTVNWDPEPSVLPLPITHVDTPGGDHPITWCGGIPSSPTLTGSEVTCLVEQDAVIAGGGETQVDETFYLKGDMKWSRA